MVVLDASIVTLALPPAKADLGISDANQQWMITAYTLAFGGLLFAARALQGGFAAFLAPAALSLLTVTFHEPRERAKAFGVYGAISGGGAAIGLLLGGLLTEYASWRWCLLVNVPIALLGSPEGEGVEGHREHRLRHPRSSPEPSPSPGAFSHWSMRSPRPPRQGPATPAAGAMRRRWPGSASLCCCWSASS